MFGSKIGVTNVSIGSIDNGLEMKNALQTLFFWEHANLVKLVICNYYIICLKFVHKIYNITNQLTKLT